MNALLTDSTTTMFTIPYLIFLLKPVIVGSFFYIIVEIVLPTASS